MNKTSSTLRIKSKEQPVVAITDSGAYVYFRRGVKIARTVVRNRWPHIAVDLDANDEIVGIEAAGINEFTINFMLKLANVSAPLSLLSSARYLSPRRPKLNLASGR